MLPSPPPSRKREWEHLGVTRCVERKVIGGFLCRLSPPAVTGVDAEVQIIFGNSKKAVLSGRYLFRAPITRRSRCGARISSQMGWRLSPAPAFAYPAKLLLLLCQQGCSGSAAYQKGEMG